jgi:hypothetical protein
MMTTSLHAESAAARRWWLPSLTQFLWIAFFLAILLTEWRQVLINADGDPCWHWQTGSWMIEHHAILRHDLFSHTQPGAPFITKEWLSEVLFAAAGNRLGWNGVVLVAALVIATTLTLLHRQLLAEGSDTLLSTALVMLAALACSMHWLARPHLYTLLLVVVFVWQLRWFDRDRVTARQLFLRLVPLTVLWTNLHGGFLAGLTLIGIYFVGNIMRVMMDDLSLQPGVRRRAITLGILGVTCALATLLNPNGWKLHQYLLGFLRRSSQVHFTSEWNSANFHFAGTHGFALQLLVLGFILIVVRRPWVSTDLLLVAFWLCAGLNAMRNIPIFALIATPIFAEHLSAGWRDLRNSPWSRWFHRLSNDVGIMNRTAGGNGLVATVLAAMLLILAKPVLVGGHPIVETEISANRFPVATVNYLQAHPQTVHGEMFNEDGWGGYFIRYLPEHKVFIDGRDDFYNATFLHEFTEVSHLTPTWETVLEKYHVGWTILPAQHPLNRILEMRTDWQLVFSNQQTLVFSHGSS